MTNKGPTCPQSGECAEEQRREHHPYKRKRGGRRGDARVAKSNQKTGQGRGPKRGGDPGSASGQFPRRLLQRIPLWASLVGRSGIRAPRTSPPSTPGLFPAQTRRAQPSRVSLTPEEPLASSSSSPLQAGDAGLTARSQKVAPSGARSPPTVRPGPSPSATAATADPDAESGSGGSDNIPTFSRRRSWRKPRRSRGVFGKPQGSFSRPHPQPWGGRKGGRS